MENKYYTPEVEELHIGFEYEIAYRNPGFEKGKIFDGANLDWLIEHLKNNKNAEVRVKYLDIEDVESLGWIKRETLGYSFNDEFFMLFGMLKSVYGIRRYLSIVQGKDPKTAVIRFSGDIKNKSELKHLMQQLGIK